MEVHLAIVSFKYKLVKS